MPQLLDELKEHLAAGEVVVVAGTGVSVQATKNAPCASWKGLLLNGVEHARELGLMSEPVANLTRQQIALNEPDMLIGAAQTITAKLGAELGPWLKRSVGPLHAEEPAIIEAIHDLGAVIATTNYDHLLSTHELRPFDWTDAASVEEILRGQRRGVIHLHGDYEKPQSVILDLKSYERIKSSAHATAVLTAIRMLKTMLFIGCGDGLNDPHFGAFFRWTEQAFSDSRFRHFILCRDSEAEKIRSEHLPERKLHPIGYGDDFTKLVPFLHLLRGAHPAVAPPPARPAHAALPDPGPCFGREPEIDTIVRALLADTPARVTVLGTGGIGKTTLTLKALRDRQVAARFTEARHFVRCEGATNRDGVVGAIASQLGVSSVARLDQAVLAALAAKPAVLVLDNFETPWQAAMMDVEEYLGAISGIDSLNLVVTIRGTERPAGVAWTAAVEPPLLPLPDARRAFLAIAGEKFANDPSLDPLLESIDRLPIAISLMSHLAQREATLAPLLQRWNDKRTEMLQRAGGANKANNIEVSFELSIGSPRMTAEAKRLASVLATLPGGIANAHLNAIMDDGEEAAAVLRGTAVAFNEGDRLRMLAPLRAYVTRRYPPDPADAARADEHYAALAVRGDEVGRAAGAAAVETITPEVANIETVLLRLLASRAPKESSNAIHGWAEFIRYTGFGSVSILDRACVRAAEADDRATETSHVLDRAKLAVDRSDYEPARANLERIRTLARERGARRIEALAVARLGTVAFNLDEDDAARSMILEALEIFREVSDTHGQGYCALTLAKIELAAKNYEVAKAKFRDALELNDPADVTSYANALIGLAEVEYRSGDAGAAFAQFEKTLEIYRATGSPLGQGNCLMRMAEIVAARGEKERALLLTQQALACFEALGEPYSIGRAHRALAIFVTDATLRRQHLAAAREAWSRIGRNDLIAGLGQD